MESMEVSLGSTVLSITALNIAVSQIATEQMTGVINEYWAVLELWALYKGSYMGSTWLTGNHEMKVIDFE